MSVSLKVAIVTGAPDLRVMMRIEFSVLIEMMLSQVVEM